jgi:hypothetical protein
MVGEQQVAELVRKLNRLEMRINAELVHVRMLRGVRSNIEARTLVETVNNLCRAAGELEDYLLHLVGEAQSTVRRFPAPRSFRPRNLSQQQALNVGYASAVGYRNEVRALAQRLPRELQVLLNELQTLAGEAQLALNNPGRYGDAAASVPINDLFSFFFSSLDAIAKWVEQRRVSARLGA